MKKMITALLVVVIMLAGLSIPAQAVAEKFVDVKPGAWYYTAVDYVANKGLFQGTSSNTFTPNGAFTRGMIVKVLGDMAGIDKTDYPGSRFSDVRPGQWYAPYVEWAVENGIAESVGNDSFAPNRNVTREEMAVIFYRYAEYVGAELTVRAGLLEQFSDGQRVSKPARYSMEWAVTHKVFQGSGGKLDPQGSITRAQVAQLLYNCRDLFKIGNRPQVPESTPTPDVSPEPSPSPDTKNPKIAISDEVRAKLKPNQDPEKILDYVMNGKHDDPCFSYDGTKAIWEPSIMDTSDYAKMAVGSWVNIESDSRSSSAIGNLIQQVLNRTASDRFYITAKAEDGYFCLYYHPGNKSDSSKMQKIKSLLDLPASIQYDRSLCYEGSGWAGPLRWEQYGGAQGIAMKIEYYLTDMHQAIQYYLTEPEPGVFYLLYGE